MQTQDWRGNAYELYEPIGKDCDIPGCISRAVRLECGHGQTGRTHWHGEVHVKSTEGSKLMALCREHGEGVYFPHGRDCRCGCGPIYGPEAAVRQAEEA